MAKNTFYQREFDKHATNGVIGDPNGKPAFGYIRVSSQKQSGKNHSGLDQEIKAIHECAKEKGFSISWDMVLSDDESGYVWTSRDGFMTLIEEIHTPTRRSNVVFCYSANRFSRDEFGARNWLLIEKFEKVGAKVIFADGWTRPSTQKEEELKKAKEAILRKAQDGRITAKVPSLGYKFVDSKGRTDSSAVSEDTHLAIDEFRQPCIEFIFNRIAYGGLSVFELVNVLNERAKTDPVFKPRRAKKGWSESTIKGIVSNTVYKGEFLCNRVWFEKIEIPTGEGERTRRHSIKHYHPKEEWQTIPVPPIVSEETWQTANEKLGRKGIRRPRVNEYLLSGILRCTCGRRLHGHTDSKKGHIQRYYCAYHHQTDKQKEDQPCDQPSIHCEAIDSAVLSVVFEFISKPALIAEMLEKRLNRNATGDMTNQITYLESEIQKLEKEDERMKQLYKEEFYTAQEYGREHKNFIVERDKLLDAIKRLKQQIQIAEQADQQIAKVKEFISHVRQADTVEIEGFMEDTPMEAKQRLLRVLCREIVLDSKKGEFTMYGRIGEKTYSLESDNSNISRFKLELPDLKFCLTCNLSERKITHTEVKIA